MRSEYGERLIDVNDRWIAHGGEQIEEQIRSCAIFADIYQIRPKVFEAEQGRARRDGQVAPVERVADELLA